MLKNKLDINNQVELLKEERITKVKAYDMYLSGKVNEFEIGTFKELQEIHKYLFEDIYDFAGQLREENISKGNFRFASSLYLKDILKQIDKMSQKIFDEIIEKYVEMNIAHPFLEGNGRSTRIWLDLILKQELGQVIDWSKVNKEDYLLAMERSHIKDLEIKDLLNKALVLDSVDRTFHMKQIDASYNYEGMNSYKTEDLVS